jgi:hypothetical protein
LARLETDSGKIFATGGRGIVKIRTTGYQYEGEFKDGREHGQGSTRHANGDRYEGQFVNGIPDGIGVCHYRSGDRYEGSYKAGQRSGKGTYYSLNGDRFVGEYLEVDKDKGMEQFTISMVISSKENITMDSPTGPGVKTSKDWRFEGEYQEGQPIGHCVISFPDGTRLEGPYVGGLPCGSFLFYTQMDNPFPTLQCSESEPFEFMRKQCAFSIKIESEYSKFRLKSNNV